MKDEDLIYYTREIIRRGCEVEADLPRKLPDSASQPALTLSAPAVVPPEKHRPVIAPLSAETYKVQFTASWSLRD